MPSPGSPEPTPFDARRFPVREVGFGHLGRWLALGWRDLRRCPVPGLLHGLAATAFGLAAWLVAYDLFWVLAGAFSGFLLVAPITATGVYELSRRLEQGEQPSLADSLRIWRGHDPRLVHFGVLLAFAGTGWVLTSASLVTAFAGAPIERPLDFLRLIMLADRGWLFEIWLVLGALLAAPVFASSVVAIPLLLERDATVLEAVLTSWRAVLASPAPLALWAGLILGLTLLGMAPLLLGLVVVVPWLGHASWHAYRDIVEPASPPPAPPAAERR
jgi:uncharacterized membrane protein